MQGSPRIDELRQKFHENPRRYFAPLANEYRKAGDPEQAIAICRAHLAQQPQHMSGHVVYGRALYDAKRADEARTVFEKALALDPDNTIVLRQLGDIAREKGESAEARLWYGKALDLDPQDSEAAAYLAELEEPLVGAGESGETGELTSSDTPEELEVLETVEPQTEKPQTEEPVGDPSSAEEQGDGAEAEPEAESTFVMSEGAGVSPAGTPAVPEKQQSRASDDGMPEAEQPPEPVEAAEPEVPWRKTPRPVESPFVTRTMAELYVKQGYTQAALDVYRQLAIQHPDDAAIRQRIEELSPAAGSPGQAGEPSPELEDERSGSIYMPDTDFSILDEARTGAPIDPEGRHFSDIDLELDTESPGGAVEASIFDDSAAVDDPPAEIKKEDIWGDLSEAGDEEAFGERVAELDWTDPGFGFGASEPEAPETEPVAELEKREDEAESAEEGTGVANGARFVEMPVMLGEFQTSIDEAGMASTSPHESEIAATGEKASPMRATTDETVEADFRGDEAAAAMAAGEAAAMESDEEAGVVAYSPEPPRDEDLPHFTPRVPTVREFFATLGSRKPPAAGAVETFTARAAVPDVASQPPTPADDLPLANDAFSNLFPGEEIADEDTRAAFALSGALSGTSHNPVPEKLQTPPEPQEPVATENHARESEEDIRRFREWLDGLADS